jgi:hypothetical protein
MSFIARRLESLKGEIALYYEKIQEVQEHSKGEKLAGLASCSVPLQKPEPGPGKKPTNMDDIVKKVPLLLQLQFSTTFIIEVYFNPSF